jgi:nucleotide-binding universal stress UspA family protein
MGIEPLVVGTDGSDTAERAVDKAGELAKALGAAVHVVSAYSSSTSGAWMAATAGVALASEMVTETHPRELAQECAERGCRRLAAVGVEAYPHVSSADPAEALMSIAEGEHAQMLVVGNRGMSGARRILGSVPNRVSHHARCSVLIVPTCD